MLSKDVPVQAWTSFADISHETELQTFVGLNDGEVGRDKRLKKIWCLILLQLDLVVGASSPSAVAWWLSIQKGASSARHVDIKNCHDRILSFWTS